MLARFPRRRRTTLGALTAAALVCALPVTAASAAAPRVKCKDGQVPVIAGTASKPKLQLKKGKPQCKPAPKLKASAVEAPAASPQGTVASTVDQLTAALNANPKALAKAERRLGKGATKKLLTRSMNDWRPAAQAQGRRLADDGKFHFDTTFGEASKGTAGSVTIDAGPANGDGSGIKATATIELQADAKGLKSLGADKITSASKAGVKLEVSFEDAPAMCPTAAGRVEGRVVASAKLTFTADGKPTTVSAKVEAKYHLSVGGDARWKTIDGVDVWTTFSYSAPGEKTSTWKGNRAGTGFSEKGIFSEKGGDASKAITEASSHIRSDIGGVWGPRGRVLFSDPSTDNIFNYGGSIDHLKGMVLTDVATSLLTLAVVEYVREVVAPRGQKHWYDAEACLKLDGAPDKSKLHPNETAKVTTKNARAFDGAAAASTQTATGVASITPGSAAVPAGGQFDYTLTAPGTSPVKASWNVVALSPAGKKTISGTLSEADVFTVQLDSTEEGDFGTHHGTAKLTGSVKTSLSAGSSTNESSGSGPVTWTPQSAGTKLKDQYQDSWVEQPVGSGTWTAVITPLPQDQILVKLYFSEDTVLWYDLWIDEYPDPSSGEDPPPVKTQLQFAMPVALGMVADWTMPAIGGEHRLSNAILLDGDGLTSTAVVTVTPGG